MIKIVSFLLQLVGVAGGVFLGLSLKGGAPATPHDVEGVMEETGDAASEKKTKDDKKDKDGKKDKKAKDDNHGEEDKSNSNHVFVKFSRQFIVPVIQPDGANSLVMLDINLEVSSSASETAYAQEPKVRDALLSTLLELSTEGAFNAGFTDQSNLEDMRARLLASAREVLNEDVHEVLILSLARQSF